MSKQLLSHASLIITYKCTARCRHCEVCCGPSKSGLMTLADARDHFVSLRRLGAKPEEGTGISGGEPFLYKKRMIDILKVGQEVYGKDSRFDAETNAYWCNDDAIVRDTYEGLRSLCHMVVSSMDFFHLEFIPFENIRRSLRIAGEVFNLGHIPHFTLVYEEYKGRRAVSCAEAVRREGVGLCGNAAFSLAPFVEAKPAEAFRDIRCDKEMIQFHKVHIDPYGNVFPPCRCIGILLGNTGERKGGLFDLVTDVKHGHFPNEVVRILAVSGPVGLYEKAMEFGYVPLPDGYANGCHLCYMVRHYLFTKGHYRDALGPKEVYEPTAGADLGSEITMKQ